MTPNPRPHVRSEASVLRACPTSTLTVPDWLPCPLNDLLRMHWAKRNRVLRIEAEFVAGYARLQHIPRARGKRRVSLRMVLQGQDKVRDADGCWKGILDHLVKARLLIDDSVEFVELGNVTFECGERRATAIVLEDI